jgi:hypothetical protein
MMKECPHEVSTALQIPLAKVILVVLYRHWKANFGMRVDETGFMRKYPNS